VSDLGTPRKANGWQPPAAELAEAALLNGPMIFAGRHYEAAGKRLFNLATVNELIARGVAVKIGRGVVHRDHVEAARD
jgi:hypothetical protein